MYVNFVEVVVRQTDDLYGGEIQEAISVRTFPAEDSVDADGVTQATRRWAMRNGYTRTTFEERRHYTDAGAAGSSLTFVMEVLGAAAAGVGLQEIVNYMKSRIGHAPDDQSAEWFKGCTTEELRDYTLSDAERTLELPRGDLKLDDITREEFELRLRARSGATGRR
jgi:hypothetical protein